MGFKFIDQYTILHFATGVIAYFWYFKFWTAFSLHFLFEIVENTPMGMRFINQYFPKNGPFRWPGDKTEPDSLLNSTGDQLFFVFGYLLSQWIDNVANSRGWFYSH